MPQLPGTDLTVSDLCLGGNVFGWTADEPTSFALLDRFTDAVPSTQSPFVDTAEMYGNGVSEQILGRWQAKGMTNPMYLDSGRPEVLAAFRARGDVTTTLSRPFYPAGTSGTAETLGQEMLQQIGLDSVIGEAKAAGLVVWVLRTRRAAWTSS